LRKDIAEIIPIIGALFSRKGRNVDFGSHHNLNYNNQQNSKVKLKNVFFTNKEYIEKALPAEILDVFLNNNGFNSISVYIKSFGNNIIPFDILYNFLKPYYFVLFFF
jgi:hypothetical protein